MVHKSIITHCQILVDQLTNSNFVPTDCEDSIDECSSLEPRDCYYDYYATSCCKTCCFLVQNPSDENCLYGDVGTGCPNLVPEICGLSPRYCCESCAAYRLSTNNSCTQGDFKGLLELLSVWGDRTLATCKQMVKHDPSFCQDYAFRKYCCASCSGVKMIKGE